MDDSDLKVLNFLIKNGDKMIFASSIHRHLQFNKLVIILFFVWVKLGFGQASPTFLPVTDLSVSFSPSTPPTNVNVGNIISVQVEVSLVVNEPNESVIETILAVPNSETITAVVELRDNDNNLLNSHTQTFNGFTNGRGDRILDNTANSDGSVQNQVSFLIPWTEAAKKEDLKTSGE